MKKKASGASGREKSFRFEESALRLRAGRTVDTIVDDEIMKKTTVKYDQSGISEYSSINRIAQRVPANTEVLDVGCSTGYLGKLLKKKGCVVSGIEMNPDAAKKAAEEYQEVFVQNLDDFGGASSGPQVYDVLVFGDILEHLKEPGHLLKRMRPLLNDNGLIVVSLPNVANWSMRFHVLRGKFDYVAYGLLDETHLRFFHMDSARKMIEDAGFAVVDTDVTPGVDKLVPYRLLTRPLTYFSWYRKFEYWLTGKLPRLFAHQIIFVAKKNE